MPATPTPYDSLPAPDTLSKAERAILDAVLHYGITRVIEEGVVFDVANATGQLEIAYDVLSHLEEYAKGLT